MKTKTYTTAPLPFMGQKRRFLNQFKQALNDNPATTYVDLFGGSGLLSHTAKRTRPDARVIYNDYDNYLQRLANVDRTNAHLAHIRQLVDGLPPDKKLPEDIRLQVIDYLANQEQSGFVDYITLSSSLLFSMNYANNLAELTKQTMYNCVRKADYDATGYLDGLEVVSLDYKEVFARFKDVPGVVFFVDPPYLSTEAGTYKSYWRLADYLDVLNVLKYTNYFYFTSNKSSIIELCEWIETNLAATNPFRGATVTTTSNQLTYNSSYTDMMLHKCGVGYDYKP